MSSIIILKIDSVVNCCLFVCSSIDLDMATHTKTTTVRIQTETTAFVIFLYACRLHAYHLVKVNKDSERNSVLTLFA